MLQKTVPFKITDLDVQYDRFSIDETTYKRRVLEVMKSDVYPAIFVRRQYHNKFDYEVDNYGLSLKFDENFEGSRSRQEEHEENGDGRQSL